jgi:DNA (cytosine-5)-methyltransferase 1
MNVLELFAGCGGAALGLERAGLHHVACVERDPYACATLRAAGLPAVEQDITTGTDWSGYTADVVWGSPPCQPYSKGGRQLGADDDRDGWPAFLHAVESVGPRWVLWENVRGVPAEEWCAALRGLGYAWSGWRELDAADYGVPQHRRRVFGVAGSAPIRWPAPTHCDPSLPMLAAVLEPWVSCGEALGVEVRCFATRAEGADRTQDRRVRDLSHRPSVCLGTPRGLNQAGQPFILGSSGRRKPTLRECARLQGFPDGHPFQGTKGARYRQVGNAVPPILAEVLGRAVLDADR